MQSILKSIKHVKPLKIKLGNIIVLVNRKNIPATKLTHRIVIDNKIYRYSDADMLRFDTRTLRNMKRKAKKLNLPCTITAEELRNWWLTTPNVCTYCGSTVKEYSIMSKFIMEYTGNDLTITRFKNAFNLPNHKTIHTMTKDRIDCSKGYTIDNLCKTCWLCNHMKGQQKFTFDEWKQIAPMIIGKLKSCAYRIYI